MAVTVIGFRVDETGTSVSVDDTGVARDLFRRGWFPSKPATIAERTDLRAWGVERLAEIHAWEDRMIQEDTADDASLVAAFYTWVAANKSNPFVRRHLRALLGIYRAGGS